MNRFYAILLLLFMGQGQLAFSGSNVFAERCARLLIEKTFQAHSPPIGLKLVAGPEVPYPIFSQNFAGQKRLQDVLLMLDQINSEAELIRVAKILAQGESPDELIARIRARIESGDRFMPLTEVLPEFARKTTNQFSKCNGPNCLNASAAWDDVNLGVDGLSYGSMTRKLRDYYKQLAPGEPLEFGDIAAVYVKNEGGEPTLYHTARVLNEGLVWHKASRFASDPWTFETMEGMLSFYTDYWQFDIQETTIRFYRKKR